MRIGILSDTHIPQVCQEIPSEVRKAFQGVELILHAGDIFSLFVLDELENIAPVLAAEGDDDFPGRDPRVKERHSVEVEGHTLWLSHMRPWLASMLKGQLSINPHSQEKEGRPNIIIFGHQHRTVVELYNGILYVCPGSPTFLHHRQGLGTVGILELSLGRVNVQMVQL